MAPKSIGEQELRLLEHIAAKGPCTVGEVAEEFGAARGLARSTVLTVMERLREKGHLRRKREGGVYRYSSPRSQAELLQSAVGSFVERTLSGSVSPFVTYLAEKSEQVSEEELNQFSNALSDGLLEKENSE